MNKILVAVIISTALFITSAIADDINPETLDSDISFVITNGLWKEGDKYGRYRLVVKKLGQEHTRSFIYLQWLYLDKNAEEKVLNSVPIDEFNTGDWRNFESAIFKKNKFTLNYTNRGRETDQKAILIPGSPGKYKIDIKHEQFE